MKKKLLILISALFLIGSYTFARPVRDVEMAFRIAVNVEMENSESNISDYGVIALKTYETVMEPQSDEDMYAAKRILKDSFTANDMTFIDEAVYESTGLIRMLFRLVSEPSGYNYVEWNYRTGETAVYSIVNLE